MWAEEVPGGGCGVADDEDFGLGNDGDPGLGRGHRGAVRVATLWTRGTDPFGILMN